MNRKQKKMLVRILLAVALFVLAFLLPLGGIGKLVVFLIPYLVIGWDVLWKSVQNIARGQIFDENFLMALATVGALVLQDYPEAVFVMLFYQIGELFQSIAVGKSRKSIASLMDIRPDYANIERNGELVALDPEEISVGDVIWVKPGEKIPLDGTILEGSSSLNTVALTGEPAPRDVFPGETVISGCVNLSGLLKICVNKPFEESTVCKILELVENSSTRKAKAEAFISRFARYYTPGVVLAAFCLAVLPPLFSLGSWSEWIRRALTFLVISCPCALVISVPLAFFGGIGGASRCGILVKGANYLEALSRCETVVFDKTGTLTNGTFSVTEIHPVDCSEEDLLRMAAAAESYSDHPISLSLKAALPTDSAPLPIVSTPEELSGLGILASVNGNAVAVGNARLMQSLGLDIPKTNSLGTLVHVAENGIYRGFLTISDAVKPDAQEAITALRRLGIRRTVMLTGDRKEVGEAVCAQLNLDEVRAELLPADKVAQVESLLSDLSSNGKLAFIGDGINDAPVLARADIGIAMGALGSDAAIEAADIVLMDDRPAKIPLAIAISRRTQRIVIQNIVFAIGVKGIVLLLGALGMASMWAAVFADVGVAVLAILNSMRTLRAKFTE